MFLEFLQGITGVFVVVYDGQHALKFTLGRAKGVVGPGIHWKWPIVQRFRVEETKHTTLDLEPQVIQLADDLVYEVDAKVLYQITNLHKALIEVDELVTAMQNRIVMAIQGVVSQQTRDTITDVDAIVGSILEHLRTMEEQWGVRILQLGFSNISPSPATLEITQLDLLARERHKLYSELIDQGTAADAAVALVTGAVVATHPLPEPQGLRDERGALASARLDVEEELERKRREERRAAKERREHDKGPNPARTPTTATRRTTRMRSTLRSAAASSDPSSSSCAERGPSSSTRSSSSPRPIRS
ncbi:MAG: SPFH domain-containing protein [Planctomycetota bacterium]